MLLRIFGVSIGITILGLVLAGFYGGWEALGIVAILIVLEVSISFDNAVVNATVLQRMSVPWQRIFLTVGVLIAVFGMRLVFPLLIVSAVAQLTPWDAFMLALQRGDAHDPGTYGYILHEAHPAIAAFGGIFLLMLFLDFVFGERELRWLRWFEVPLARVGRLDAAAAIVALAVLVLASTFLADPEDRYTVLLAGVLGLGSYLLVNALSRVFHVEVDDEAAAHAGEVKKVVGKAAFFLFLYLEVLDASFSFDGVIGAFAITSDPVLILVGLGVGAFYIGRSRSTWSGRGRSGSSGISSTARCGPSAHSRSSCCCRSG